MTVAAHLVWEAAQMPLYTLWRTGSAGDIAFAVLHCTAGDLLIAGASLLGALALCGAPGWPRERFAQVATAAIVFGLGYTIHSEYLNLARGTWTYLEMMPVLPWLGTGLAPFTQWLAVPMASLAWAARPNRVRSLSATASNTLT